MKALKTQYMEAFCPDHLRRHRMIVGMTDGAKVAQCPGEGCEWDIDTINQRLKRVILVVGSRRTVKQELEVEG